MFTGLVLSRLGNSLYLAGMTLAIVIPLSLLLGVPAALREGSWTDSVISVASLSVVGLPEFVTGIVLINGFALALGWLPASLVLTGYITRTTRAGMLEELRKPYVRIARLKGIPYRRVVFTHALRNTLLPTIAVIALSIG